MSCLPFRAGYVAIVGRPNVGKSTLLNQFLQQKLSIVTPKPQTTRHRVLGVLSGADFQVVFLDTPGIMEPGYALHRWMQKVTFAAIDDADLILWLVEPWTGPHPEDAALVERLAGGGRPVVLAINKVDRVRKETLLPLTESYQRLHHFEAIVPISALDNDGVQELLGVVTGALPQHEPFFPMDVLTDQPERFFVAEIIRERLFSRYGEEIPYSCSVLLEEFRERPRRKDYIRATIYVERESQKAIVVGDKGEALKRVGQEARTAIEELLNRPVYLELWVKVKEAWRKSEKTLSDLGYV
jgi:GTP-binding protein Era